MLQFQIGVGLMVCQQFVGINGIGFYTAQTFVAAGKSKNYILVLNILSNRCV